MFSSASPTLDRSADRRPPGLSWPWLLGLGLLYLVTHFLFLTKLPVFADEAIYIRWAQLIMDDAHRYAFFALNDGKTPLFIWLLIPFQYLFSDQLAAARSVSVLVGLAQVGVMIALTRELGGRKWAQVLAGFASTLLPFWFFHHRMALMDSLLVLWLSLSWLAVLRAIVTRQWRWVVLSGGAFGLGLLTKLPAILFLPALALAATGPFWIGEKATRLTFTRQTAIPWLIKATVAGGIGLSLFALLKLNPAFGQLFSRGGDFLYKTAELTPARILKNLWEHSHDFIGVFGAYLGWGSLGLMLMGLVLRKYRLTILLLLGMTVAYLLPIMILGRVIYPRYLLPAALPLTVAFILATESVITHLIQQKNLVLKTVLTVLFAILAAQVVTNGTRFLLYSWLNPKYLAFTPADQVQYLTEWSAGDGLQPVSAAALQTAQHSSLLVLTEGYFGSLPDGILLYLHGKDVHNLFVEGIGQPVNSIPATMITKAQAYDQVWLVVNSHRMHLNLPSDQKIQEYCRLPGTPCLQVWNLKPYLEQLPVLNPSPSPTPSP